MKQPVLDPAGLGKLSDQRIGELTPASWLVRN